MTCMKETSRQAFHLFGVAFFACLAFFAGREAALFAAVLILAFGVVIVSLFRRKHFPQLLKKALRDSERKHEKDFPARAALVALASIAIVIVAFYNFPIEVTVGALLVLAFEDSISTIVGIKHGRTMIGKKSLEGSIAGTVAAFIPLLLLFSPSKAFLAAAFGALAEHFPIEDNLAVPLFAGLVLIVL